jgi:hypothetical protein
MTDTALRTRIQELEDIVAATTRAQTPASGGEKYDVDEKQPLDSAFSYSNCVRFQKFFLDSDFPVEPSQSCRPEMNIPPAVLDHVGSHNKRSAIIETHFQTTHRWMSIVSKVRLDSMVTRESKAAQHSPDFILLVLSMKLIQQMPQESTRLQQESLYILAKQLCASLEMAGIQSMLKLQASLLIAAFETNHAIYPAAYMSMGYCVTQAFALGLQNKEAPQLLAAPLSWPQWDERVRVWWQVVIFDWFDPSPRATIGILPDISTAIYRPVGIIAHCLPRNRR